MIRKILLFIVLMFSCGGSAWSQQDDSSRVVLKVLTFNVFHGATMQKDYNLDIIADVIKEADPDMVALQEIDFMTERNGRCDLTAALGSRTGMISLFGRSMYFNGGEYGIGILSAHTFISSRLVRLPGTEGREPRTALQITTVLPSGDTIAFVCTHLDHQVESDRIRQAETINNMFATGGSPVILAGDLNAEPGSLPLSILEERWLQSYDSLSAEPTFPSSAPNVKIDYVMCYPKARWKVISSEVIHNTVASDHCALLVTLELVRE